MKCSANVLFTNIGRRGYLVDYLRASEEFEGHIYASDCDETASGLYSDNDGHFLLPKPVDDENCYVDALLDVCKKYEISLVIPVIDPEIYILSKYKTLFENNGIVLAVSNRDVLEICFNKIQMNQFLHRYGFNYPKTYKSPREFDCAYVDGKIEFPVILKPIFGSGSEETYYVDSASKLLALYHEGMMIQEIIGGTEYGCDVFNTFEKKPVRCVIKKKISMRSGETDKSLVIKDGQKQNMMIRLANELGHVGNLDCDFIERDGNCYIIDLNPRFGGGYPATHVAGVNLLDILVRCISNVNIEPDFEHYHDGLLVMKKISVCVVNFEGR